MFDRVPDELQRYRQWVCHQFPDKMPRCPYPDDYGNLVPAKCSDPLTWGSFDQAVMQVERGRAKGVGIQLANGIVGVDIDDCVDGGELSQFSRLIVERLRSYAEFSPSGTGIHILCKGKLPGPGRKKTELGLEMYDISRYFTVTGDAYLDEDGYAYPFRDCSSEVDKLYREYFDETPPEQMKLGRRPESVQPAPPPAGEQVRELSDREILDIAFKSASGAAMKRLYDGTYSIGEVSCKSDGTVDLSAVDFALVSHLAFWFNRDADRIDQVFRGSALYRSKWDRSSGGGKTYGQRTIERACQSTRDTFVPVDRKRGGYEPPPFPEPPPSPPKQEGKPPELAVPDEAEIAANPTKYTYDDTGNAHRFRDAYYKDLRFNFIDEAWYYWTGQRWMKDMTEEVKRRADRLLEQMEEEARCKMDEFSGPMMKLVRRTRNFRPKEAMIREAQHLEGVPILSNEFDRYKDALNVQNGVIELRTGKLRPHNRKLLLSMMANVKYDEAAKCPRWTRFLDEITDGNTELQTYLQYMVGYFLTGETKEQCIFFLYGNGNNGKSKFLDTLSTILGDYARNSQAETVMQRNRGAQGARSDLARLKGARMVTTSEPEQGCRLDEGTIKQMTGGEVLTVRPLYLTEIEFKPEFKLSIGTNVKPYIKGTDYGIWRRVRMIPFIVQISPENVDLHLGEKLLAEKSGILNWALEGARLWYQHGLPPCAVIDQAGKEYRREMDRMQQFVEECIRHAAGHTLQSSVLFGVYKKWSEQNGERYPLSSTRFGMELQERYGLRKQKTARCNEYVDVDFTEDGNQLLSLESSFTYR